MMQPARDVVEFTTSVLGLDLHARQAEALRGVAASSLSLLCLGRRSGKTLLAACWAVYDAVVRDLSAHLRPGEPRYIVTVATTREQARIAFRAIRTCFDLPALAPLLVHETADELTLATDVRVKCLPCSARSTRGLPISTVIFDELAHFQDTDNGYQVGEQVYLALAPSAAQFGDAGRLLALSTPRGQRGMFWRLWTAPGDSIYRLQASTAEMNRAISASFLERERLRDPELFAQEFKAQFTVGSGAFLCPESLRAAVGIPKHRHGLRVLALDPAFVRDRFALALACRDGGAIHLEAVQVLEPPVSFSEAMDAVARTAMEVQPRELVTDQFAAAPIVQELGRRGIHCSVVSWTAAGKAEAYAGFKAALNTGRLRLVEDSRLLAELAGLEATPTAAGFSVEGERDDLAAAGALAVWRLAGLREPRTFAPVAGGGDQGLMALAHQLRRELPRRRPWWG